MITVEKVLFLRHVSLFATVPTRDLGHVAGITDEVVHPAGSTIFVQGARGESMFLVVEGEVGIYWGKAKLTTIRERGYFGEMSILDNEPRSASAVADTDCLLLRLQRDDFHRILHAHFGASLAIIQTLTRRLREVTTAATPPRAEVNVEGDRLREVPELRDDAKEEMNGEGQLQLDQPAKE